MSASWGEIAAFVLVLLVPILSVVLYKPKKKKDKDAMSEGSDDA